MARTLTTMMLLAAAAAIGQTPENDVRRVLEVQTADWNRGDIPSFVKTYAVDAVFIGREVSRGSKGVLERYQRTYPNRDAMGKLTFSQIEVTMLGANHAMVIGRFHLVRSAAGGGDARGIFSLVLKKARED